MFFKDCQVFFLRSEAGGARTRFGTPVNLRTTTVKGFRGRLVFEAHRLVHHSTLGSRAIKKKKQHQVAHEQAFVRFMQEALECPHSGSNRVSQFIDVSWRSPKSSVLWHKSRRFARTICSTHQVAHEQAFVRIVKEALERLRGLHRAAYLSRASGLCLRTLVYW